MQKLFENYTNEKKNFVRMLWSYSNKTTISFILAEIDEDVGYETLRKSLSTDSKDSNSMTSYVVHDRSLRSELNEYSKRLNILLHNLHSDLLRRDKRKIWLRFI